MKVRWRIEYSQKAKLDLFRSRIDPLDRATLPSRLLELARYLLMSRGRPGGSFAVGNEQYNCRRWVFDRLACEYTVRRQTHRSRWKFWRRETIYMIEITSVFLIPLPPPR